MKVVMNNFWGGFSLSEDAWKLYVKKKGTEDPAQNGRNLPRHDPVLVAVVEKLGSERASGDLATLAIVEIPDGVEYVILDNDGWETVAEKHRTWEPKRRKSPDSLSHRGEPLSRGGDNR